MRERIESKHVTKEIKSQMPVIPVEIIKERGCTFCPYYMGSYEKQPRCMMKNCAWDDENERFHPILRGLIPFYKEKMEKAEEKFLAMKKIYTTLLGMFADEMKQEELEKDECYGCAYGKCGPCIGICYKSMKALKDAAMKLADDFGIPYSGRDRGSPQNRRSVSAKKPEPTPEELWQKKHLRCLRAYLDYLSLLLEWKEQYAPKTRTEEWHEKFMTALRELSVVEYYLDILLFGDRADKEALVKEKWKEVERIEQCEREDKGDRHKRTERCHERNAPDGR